MKSIILGALLLSTSAFADNLHCTLSLIANMPDTKGELWIAPMTGIYEFDYDTTKEMQFGVKVVARVPGNFPQYKLAKAETKEETALTIDFSRTEPDGTKMSGDDFGFYFRLPGEKPNQSAWSLGGYSEAALTSITIAKDQKGYVVMNCR